MSNTSSTGGYLQPLEITPPFEDDELDRFLQGIVVGVTGLPINFVRPRWQPIEPKQPEGTVDWCAIGIVDEAPDGVQPMVAHYVDADGNGYDESRTQQRLTVLASFYGPRCRGNAGALRDGLMVAQNREAIFVANVALVETDAVRMVPTLTNQRWIKRADLQIVLRRGVVRTYPVQNLQSGSGTLNTDEAGPSPFVLNQG